MEILFEDKNILVCYKPAGISTQTKSVGQADMVSEISNYLAKKGEKPEVYVIHRLDQPVEGVMIFAKDKESAAKLSKQVAEHSFGKRYFCIVQSDSLPKEGILEDYLVKDSRTNMSKVSFKNDRNAKHAKLSYKTIDKWDGKRLLEIELYTGRHHQIRVQLSSRQAPILGDVKYGGTRTKQSICLCSHYLSFEHPKTNEKMEFDITPKGSDFLGSILCK